MKCRVNSLQHVMVLENVSYILPQKNHLPIDMVSNIDDSETYKQYLIGF